LKKKIEESESTLKMQSAEIKRLQKLTKNSGDLLRLLLSSKDEDRLKSTVGTAS
jgi:hypothetical protein